MVLVDPRRAEGALDNLIANALEHGTLSVLVTARRGRRGVRISVVDGGAGCDGRHRRDPRRGHGLRIVGEVARQQRRTVPARSLRGAGPRPCSSFRSRTRGGGPAPRRMSRRARALAFGVAALACAGLAAAMASGYSDRRGLPARPAPAGPRREQALPARKPLGPASARSSLEVRRVPARFVPPGSLSSARPGPGPGAGGDRSRPAATCSAAQLRPGPGDGRRARRAAAWQGRSPVELAVTGAGALAARPVGPSGSRVDVVVTTEPRGAAAGTDLCRGGGVRLVNLRQSAASDTAAGGPDRRRRLDGDPGPRPPPGAEADRGGELRAGDQADRGRLDGRLQIPAHPDDALARR